VTRGLESPGQGLEFRKPERKSRERQNPRVERCGGPPIRPASRPRRSADRAGTPGRRRLLTRRLPTSKKTVEIEARDCRSSSSTTPKLERGRPQAGRGSPSKNSSRPVDRWGPAPSKRRQRLPETIESHGVQQEGPEVSRPGQLGDIPHSGTIKELLKKIRRSQKHSKRTKFNSPDGAPSTSWEKPERFLLQHRGRGAIVYRRILLPSEKF